MSCFSSESHDAIYVNEYIISIRAILSFMKRTLLTLHSRGSDAMNYVKVVEPCPHTVYTLVPCRGLIL